MAWKCPAHMPGLAEIDAQIEACLMEKPLDGAEESVLRTLRRQIRTAGEQPVRVVLCAMFQTGKSTTLNTLLGGRELSLSSIDGGLRTSTGRIELEAGVQEDVEIRWLCMEDLAQQMTQLSGLKVTAADLSLDTYRSALWRRLVQAWDTCQEGDREARMRLGYAAVLLAYSKSEALEQLRRKAWTPYETSRIMTARTDEPSLWLELSRIECEDADTLRRQVEQTFPLEWVAYLFVEYVRIKVRAPVLEEMAVQLIDIPGLGVSERDNLVAWRAVEEAQVVLYLFDGQQEPGEWERNAVRRLIQRINGARLLFAVNRRGRARMEVEQSIRQLLNSMGLTDTPLIPYHARLANCAAQGRLLLNEELDLPTQAVLLARAQESSPDLCTPEACWQEVVTDTLYRVDRDLADFVTQRGLCQETLCALEEVSGWQRLVQTLSAAALVGEEEARVRCFSRCYLLRCVGTAIQAIEPLSLAASQEEAQRIRAKAAAALLQDKEALFNALSCMKDQLFSLRLRLEALTQLSGWEVGFAERTRQEVICFIEQQLQSVPHPSPEDLVAGLHFPDAVHETQIRGRLLWHTTASVPQPAQSVERTMTYLRSYALPHIQKGCENYLRERTKTAHPSPSAPANTRCASLARILECLRGLTADLEHLTVSRRE